MTMDEQKNRDELKRLVSDHPGYPSLRQLALHTLRPDGKSYSYSTIAAVAETGAATADVAVALADALQFPRLKLLVLANKVPVLELQHPMLGTRERQLLTLFDGLASASQETLLQVAEGLWLREQRETE